jgi:hypothetical protein
MVMGDIVVTETDLKASKLAQGLKEVLEPTAKIA